MLIGEYKHSIDEKGRIFIPAKLREELGEKFIVSRGTGRMLFVFSREEWANYLARLRTNAVGNHEMQAFIRLILSSASECELDKQGRFLLNQRLRLLAQLEKEAVFLGQYNHVEIWNAENWEQYKTEYEGTAANEKFAEVAYSAEMLGI